MEATTVGEVVNYGPLWYDCAELVQVIIKDRLRSCTVQLVVALPKVYGKGYSSWAFVVRSEPLQGRKGRTVVARASWGNGGTFKTAPAALHRALSSVIHDLEEAQAVAEQAALF